MVSALLRQVFFIPQTTRISILHRIPVLANARPNFPSPSLPLRNHTSRSLSTSALRLILQSPVSTIGYAHSSTLASLSPKHLDPLPWTIRIPPICPGCGARSQTTDPNVPGFYDQEKAQAKAIKRKEKKEKRNMDKKRNAEEAIRLANLARLEQKFDFITRNIAAKPTTSSDCPATTPAPVSTDSLLTPRPTAATPKLPLCERCKSLVNYERGTPLPAYPDLDTLIDLISESKHEKTHIYHLIDAADFPLSLIPRLKSYLAHYLPPKKARNLSVSYIITRADLLMPKEEQVTSLMTYLKGVLKDALPPGEAIEDHHSPWGGSFRVISIKNAWSIRRVKAEFSHMAGLKLSKVEKGIVKSREGGIWIVGKVNVGKSRFVGEIVPEGSFTNLERVIETVSGPRASYSPELETLTGKEKLENEELDQEELSLVSPTVSYIPGTTVAPVRVAFRHPGEKGRKGGIKGEIIDLPGMERGRFLDFVRPKLRRKVHMESRVDPKQHVVKPGQSLVLAGLIMIRPKTCDTDFLMYPYTALPTHVTATEKALEFMNHPDPEIKPVSAPLAGTLPDNIKSAGTFHLSTDVTRLRNPQLRDKADAEIELLPYKIYSIDILLEGVGWVEIVAQIRTHQLMLDVVPEVEVYTPLGKGVGSRKPMGADMLRLQGLKKIGKFGVRRNPTEGRQRQSMKGRKKQSKINHRSATGGRG
ncbi:hypothetical protein L211DRAFT_821808 [Terfezia boudieri ATCC MYA-4762]|uniref:Genetic interactor of prohibitins 3, mitochondrial n=1 Tax=Terfezia boudieri ATCC MYA-4762 TaxID=1051890 RepID=A0A3N4LXJ7_9PEZI|nr:hypothetical protein L211DRAFT_821808 [Terfezia boudieri ATCC MYA-4762]